jgi:hypothetical protein
MKVCRNSLTAYGTKEDIEKMLEDIKGPNGEVFSLNSLIRIPDELVEASKNNVLSPKIVTKYGAINVNDWRYKNWGCWQEAKNSEIYAEGELSPKRIQQELEEHKDKIRESTYEQVKSIAGEINKAVSITFETDETPNYAVKVLSEKHPNILVHFGYDSEPEDVSGWIALKGGEPKGHNHFDSCLRNIRLHVEGPSDNSEKLLESWNDDDDSN